MLTYRREPLADAWAEVQPLAEEHFHEVGHFPDIPLDLHEAKYRACEDAGIFRLFTARTDSGMLVGYSSYWVDTQPHHRHSLQAFHDALFLIPEVRKLNHGSRFVAWCDDWLRREGVQVVHFASHARNPIGPMLERNGYEVEDVVYVKRLDVPAPAVAT